MPWVGFTGYWRRNRNELCSVGSARSASRSFNSAELVGREVIATRDDSCLQHGPYVAQQMPNGAPAEAHG